MNELGRQRILLGEAMSAVTQCTAILGDDQTNRMLAELDAAQSGIIRQQEGEISDLMMWWPFTDKPPPWATNLAAQATEIQKGINQIMALVQIEQGDLDTLAANLETVAQAIAALPPGTLPAADETAVNQALSDAQAALAAKTTPPA